MLRKIVSLLLVIGLLTVTGAAFAQDEEPSIEDDPSAVMIELLQALLAPGGTQDEAALATLEEIAESENPLYIAPLLDLGFFTRNANLRQLNGLILEALADMTEQEFDNWQDYYEWASENDVALPENYDEYKSLLYGTLIDPQFERFFDDVQETAQVNLLEAIWGGVRVDGIPSLVNATQISPEQALREGEAFTEFCRQGDCSYPAQDELVFGVSLNGDSRAYPLRLLNWHEMFNDVIGSAPFFDEPNGEAVCQFRAPTEFDAVARQGDAWVRVIGQSADCPSGGWLADPETLVWPGSDWETVSAELPDLSEDDSEALAREDGLPGQVDGVPVMLAYCTLCGSGVLYDPIIETEDLGEVTLEFGSTGMLMRSNKLMYDRTTDTVWNAITGEPAFGPLAGSGIQLERLPVVVTDWSTWLAEHPETSVLSLNTGFSRNYTNGAAYSEYFNDPDFIMFPVWQQDTTEQENKEVIFALNLDDTPKAYPLETIIPEMVTNDTLAGTDLVIISRETPQREFSEPGGASVRAYERGDLTFSPGESRGEIIDQDGNMWRVTEQALIGPDGDELPRLPGHLAFWFGWFSFYPETLIYE